MFEDADESCEPKRNIRKRYISSMLGTDLKTIILFPRSRFDPPLLLVLSMLLSSLLLPKRLQQAHLQPGSIPFVLVPSNPLWERQDPKDTYLSPRAQRGKGALDAWTKEILICRK